MRLVAIFHCWDDWYLLEHSVKHLRPLVDGVIIIGSTISNYGEYSPIPEEFKNEELFILEPRMGTPLMSETDKRNYGLRIALEKGYTHFITLDSDEFYNPIEFEKAKERFNNEPNLDGLVCQLQCFFKKPTLTIGIEQTLVTFIHKLTPTIRHSFNRSYPFSWINGQIRIDPSRALNINTGVEFTDKVTMFHMSWVRKDYAKKIRNSTARANIEKSTIMQDLLLAKEGYFVKFYGKVLHAVPNYFNLPEYDVLVQNL